MLRLESTAITEQGPKLTLYALFMAMSMKELFEATNSNYAIMIILNCLMITAFFYYNSLFEHPVSIALAGLLYDCLFIQILRTSFEGCCSTYVLCAHFVLFCILAVGYSACLGIMAYILSRERFAKNIPISTNLSEITKMST